MKCPGCGSTVSKGGVSRHWCDPCEQWWLIQKLSSYPPPDDLDLGHGIIDPEKLAFYSRLKNGDGHGRSPRTGGEPMTEPPSFPQWVRLKIALRGILIDRTNQGFLLIVTYLAGLPCLAGLNLVKSPGAYWLAVTDFFFLIFPHALYLIDTRETYGRKRDG